MDGIVERESSRREHVKRGLVVFCALILFALGIWLLVEPANARGAKFDTSDQDLSLMAPELIDNVIANCARLSGPTAWTART